MRALVIEDDPVSARLVGEALAAEGIVAEAAGRGEEGLELARLYDFDVVVLDVRLPDLDGCEVVRRLRAARRPVPVLMLSGRAGAADKVRALTSGADDYLAKPFDRAELAARVHAVVRRSRGHAAPVIRTGRLSLDMDARTAEVDGRRLPLTGKEYQILELLSLRRGATMTKEMFLDHLYGGVDEPELKIIDVFVCKLRKKVRQATGGEDYVETVWGRGYRLREPGAVRPRETVAA